MEAAKDGKRYGMPRPSRQGPHGIVSRLLLEFDDSAWKAHLIPDMSEQRTQRRLAAILAADVVGYSRLMERDEASTLATLKTRRKDVFEPLVARHHGRIFKEIGDALLVEFGSAVNAVECAADVQQAMATANDALPEAQRMVLRIGINLGDVVIEGDDLYGDGVNVAARLEGLAEPGGVAISDSVHEHVHGRIAVDFVDRGRQK